MANIKDNRIPVISKELTKKELEEIEKAKNMPVSFDEDCPETTPEMAMKYKRVNPVNMTV